MPHGLNSSLADVDLNPGLRHAGERRAALHNLAVNSEVPTAHSVVQFAHLQVRERDGDAGAHIQPELLDLAAEHGRDEVPVRVHADDRPVRSRVRPHRPPTSGAPGWVGRDVNRRFRHGEVGLVRRGEGAERDREGAVDGVRTAVSAERIARLDARGKTGTDDRPAGGCGFGPPL